MTERTMQTIRTFDTQVEADLARMYLEDSGFEVTLGDYYIVGLDWLRANAFGGIKLSVPESDAIAALQTLEERGTERSDDGEGAAGVDVCLACGQAMLPEEDACPACGWTYQS